MCQTKIHSVREQYDEVLDEYLHRFPHASRQQLRLTMDVYARNQLQRRLVSADDVQMRKSQAMLKYVQDANRHLHSIGSILSSHQRPDEETSLKEYALIVHLLELLRLSRVAPVPMDKVFAILQRLRHHWFFKDHLKSVVKDATERINRVDIHVNAHLVSEVANVDIPGLQSLGEHLRVPLRDMTSDKMDYLLDEYAFNRSFYDYLWVSQFRDLK
jgi:hypothetical protein